MRNSEQQLDNAQEKRFLGATFLRTLVLGWVLLMMYLARLPAFSFVSLVVLSASLLLQELLSRRQVRMAKATTIASWLASLLIIGSLVLSPSTMTFVETYFAGAAWLIAVAIAVGHSLVDPVSLKPWWKILTMSWAYLGAFLWLAAGYLQNEASLFYEGVIATAIVLVLSELWFRLPSWTLISINTLVLMLGLVPIADFLTRPPQIVDPHPEIAGNAYRYDLAKKEPHAFLHWWAKYLSQYDKLMKEVFVPDPTQMLRFRARTNSQTTFFQSEIRINSLGFRGKEVAHEKGNTYRIVAMGESTTFGFTLTREHLPWPEFLQQMINDRMRLSRPIEIINTGLPHHSLKENVYRLRTEILPLKPDMIVSYHGWNGFPWLYPSLPPIFEKHVPQFRKRPLHLLAECEFRLRMFIFKRRLSSKPPMEMPPVSRLLKTEYAHLYEELIQIARTNNICLVLGNYSMAVDAHTDPHVCEFYREIFPSVYSAIKVNQMHTTLVKELVRENPEVVYVDTNPNLDGQYLKFIDLVHFSPEGDRQLAENFFGQIKGVLETNLTK